MHKKYLISFSGAQSTGKSTLLRKCEETIKGNFSFIPEITRSLNTEFGISINEKCTEITQTLIMAKHIENHLNFKNGKRSYIMDRCILDGLVYTQYFTKAKILTDNVMLDLARRMYAMLIKDIDVIFYTDPKDVLLHDDGVRSNSVSFRNEVISLFEHYLPDLRGKVVRLQGTVEQRMQKIQDTLLSLK